MELNNTITVITDGSVRREQGVRTPQLGVLVLCPDNKVVKYKAFTQYSSTITSNECEYIALQTGLNEAYQYIKSYTHKGSVNPKDYDLVMYLDSELVVKQLINECDTKKESFKKMQKAIKLKTREYNKASIYWHRRDSDLAVVADYASRNTPVRVENLWIQYRQKDVSELIQEIYTRILTEEKKEKKNEKKSTSQVP